MGQACLPPPRLVDLQIRVGNRVASCSLSILGRQVDDAVYVLDGKASQTINQVERLDNRVQDVHAGIQAANQVSCMRALI